MAAKAAKPNTAGQKNNGNTISLQVSLPQMLDLALATPEVGAMNLNILHNFLHVLLHLINLDSAKVEYRGDHASRLKTVVETSTKDPSVQLHEYNITDGSGKVKQRDAGKEASPSAEVYTEGSKGTTSAPASARGKVPTDGNSQVKTTKGVKQQIGVDSEGGYQTVVFVEPIVDGVPPSALGYRQLDKSVKELQQRFGALEELQSNAELMERLKGKISDPLTDIWQIININKRLDANEQGIDKLMSMMQDLARTGVGGLPTESGNEGIPATESTASMSTQQLNQRVKDIENTVTEMEQVIFDLQTAMGQTPATIEPEDEPNLVVVKTEEDEKSVGDPEMEPALETPAHKIDKPSDHESKPDGKPDDKPAGKTADKPAGKSPDKPAGKTPDKHAGKSPGKPASEPADKTKAVKKEPAKQRSSVPNGRVDILGMHNDVEAIKTEMTQMRKDVYDLNVKVGELTAVSEKLSKAGEVKTEPGQKIQQKNVTGDASQENNDGNLPQFQEAIESIEKHHIDDLNEVKNRLSELEKEVGSLMEKTEGAATGGIAEDSDLNELVNKIQSIQSDMEKFNKIADRLIDDKEDREIHMNALLEQIELLKTIKADKEDLEDALADKADTQIVNRKVSHDQFDAACDDLTRGLKEAVAKLGMQESIWQQALDEVQREIEGKVDKLEITPLKDFVSNRLKSLQEKLKKVAAMTQETDAAGTKKILRDVQCISCDKNVIMKMEDPGKFHPDPLPCTISMKPYLTYKLDQVRKQQKRLPHSRDLHMFEAVMQQELKRQKAPKDETLKKTSKDRYCCNRYCGGSHTITTPQQRLPRMGRSTDQWGPMAIQLTEGTARRINKQTYKCKTLPENPEICGNSYAAQETPKIEQERFSMQSIVTQNPRESQRAKRISIASGGHAHKRSKPHEAITYHSSFVNGKVSETSPPFAPEQPTVQLLKVEPVSPADPEEATTFDEKEMQNYGL